MTLAVAVVLTASALAVRLPKLDVFITPDELKWVCRSINLHRGIHSGNLAQTRQTGHPGVITMWLGAPFMGVDVDEPWLDTCKALNISNILVEEGAALPRELGQLLFKARRSVVWFTSLCLGLSVLLLARLFGLRVASLAGVLLVLDPFLTAHSRFLHLDAVTTMLLLLAVLLLLMARRSQRWPWWAASGVAAALAMLNKSPAMFIIPYTALVVGYEWLIDRRPFKICLRHALVWAVALVVAAFAAWPALWVEPGPTIKLVLDTAFFYAENPHTNSNYFWGSPRPDPGAAFYPVALAFRLTPLSSFGFLLGLPWLVKKSERRVELWAIGAFVLFYGVFMTLGQKKFDRYLLPVLPFVDIIAAVGLWGFIDWILLRFKPSLRALAQTVTTLALAVVIALTGSSVLATSPYYLTYYNPLLGGIQAATKVLLVGWGEGLEKAAAYLNTLPAKGDNIAATRALPDFSPFYNGVAIQTVAYDPATVRYVVMYINEVQRRLDAEMLERYYDVAEPLHVVQIDGVHYAYIYENKAPRVAAETIAALGEPGRDAILVNRPSLFTDEYTGNLPVYVVDPKADQKAVQAQLESIRAHADRLWYVSFWQKDPNPLTDSVEFLLRTHAAQIETTEATDVKVTLWDLSDDISFSDTGATQAVDVRYDCGLELDSYVLSPAQARYGSGVGIALNWSVTANLSRYYSLYIHVLDETGHRWGQGDTWLVDESLVPTAEWVAGKQVTQNVAIDLAPGIMPGRYRLVLGLRDRLGDDHPKASLASGEELGLEVELGKLEVVSSPWTAGEAIKPAHADQVSLAPGLSLVGWDELPNELYMGDSADVLLYWRAEEEARPDYDVELALVDAAGVEVASQRTSVADAGYPTSAWKSGEVLARYYRLTLPDDVPWADASLQVRLLSSGQGVGERHVLGQVAVRGRLVSLPSIAHPQRATLGNSIAFLGYDLSESVSAGGTVELTLYWQALAEVEASYTVFTHLLDRAGAVKGQLDSVPLGGRLPTNSWKAGEYVADYYAIPVDAAAPAGEYQIEIGMYDAAQNATRLPLVVEGVRQQDDRLLLDTPVLVTAQTGS
ncbi:MAG: glycosyltransferase family 39 protein [Anaerolineales bacterium]